MGIKYAHWFSGTANWELKESDRLSKRTITQNLSVEGPTYGVEQDFEHRVKNSNTSVVKKLKVRSKGSISTGARTYDGLKDEFDEFPGRVEGRSGGDPYMMVVGSYKDFVDGWNNSADPFADYSETQLNRLVELAWSLETLIDSARYIEANKDLYAGMTVKKKKANKFFGSLVKDMKKAWESFKKGG